jgi:uncharacterized protein (TIGR02569 family)
VFHRPPPEGVRAAFAVDGEPVRTHTSRVWRVGDVAFKIVEDGRQHIWLSELASESKTASGFRVPPPLRSTSGEWLVDGWSASRWIDGSEDPRRWQELLTTGAAFHRWLRSIPRPQWLDSARDLWRTADLIAWGEADAVTSEPFAALIEELLAIRSSLDAVDQLIHGDLTRNVLFPSDSGDPWVIDLSLYWRPTGYAAAIVAVDCYEWEGVGGEVIDAVAAEPNGLQLLVRAALFRSVRASMESWSAPTARVKVHARTLAALRSRL